MNEATNPGSMEFPSHAERGNDSNYLRQYINNLNPEMVAHLSQPDPEVARVMEQNLIGMLGSLPAEHFGVTVTTSRENLGRLLASAMMSGYFLHNVHQRMNFERSLQTMNNEQ